MITPFLMGTTSSTIMQSLGEIDQCAPAVGAKIWCLYRYRQVLQVQVYQKLLNQWT